MTAAFLVTSLIVVASPGTGVLYTMAAGQSARQVIVSGVLVNILNPKLSIVALGAKLAFAER